MRATVLRGLIAALACASLGCHGYLVPFDERPLPAQHTLSTEGGRLLDVAGDGQLVSRPARDDVGAALGVALHESPAGVFVSNALAAGSGLQRGDQLLWAAAALPRAGRGLRAAYRTALCEAIDGSSSALESFQPSSWYHRAGDGAVVLGVGELPPPPAPAAAELRARADAHPVQRVADLRGYLCGAGWLALDLLIRRGEEERVVRVPVERRESWVPTRPELPALGRWRGLELVRVSRLPRDLRPAGAEPDDYLVTRVAWGAPLGQVGLRPLDLLRGEDARALLDGTSLELRLREQDPLQLVARAPDGELKRLRFEPRREPTQLWFPLAFAYERDQSRYHFGLGWWDVLFHASGRREYLPSMDDYVETTRWSVLTVFSGGETTSEEGTVRHAGLNLILDPVRLDYFEEWFLTPGEVERERGLEGY